MKEAQKEYDWKLDFGEIAKIWRGGCIIRAAFLQKITEAYVKIQIFRIYSWTTILKIVLINTSLVGER